MRNAHLLCAAVWAFFGLSWLARADEPAEQFQTLYREWNALDKRLDDLRDNYEKAPPASREEIRKRYEQLVERSSELLPKLGTAAEAAYAAAPNKDADAHCSRSCTVRWLPPQKIGS